MEEVAVHTVIGVASLLLACLLTIGLLQVSLWTCVKIMDRVGVWESWIQWVRWWRRAKEEGYLCPGCGARSKEWLRETQAWAETCASCRDLSEAQQHA